MRQEEDKFETLSLNKSEKGEFEDVISDKVPLGSSPVPQKRKENVNS